MRLRSSSIIPTVETVDLSSTGIKDPILVPVDGDELIGGVDGAVDTARRSATPLQLSEPSTAVPGVAPHFKADAGASLEMSASEPRTPATPDLNWLISLGER